MGQYRGKAGGQTAAAPTSPDLGALIPASSADTRVGRESAMATPRKGARRRKLRPNFIFASVARCFALKLNVLLCEDIVW